MDFSSWWGLCRTFYDLNRSLSKPLQEGENEDRYVSRKLSIQKQLDSIQETIAEKEIRLFGNSKMKMAVARAKLKKTRTYAEMYAQPNGVE